MGTNKQRVARTCRVEVTVDAAVESVWRIVADVTRTGQWSHECSHVGWLDGATAAAPGVRFRGRNRSGPWRWSRTCEVVAVDAPRQIVWRTIPTRLFVDSTDWRISLEPDGEGTRIVQTFQVTRCPDWWDWLVAHLNTPHIDRSTALTADLHRIGDVAANDTHTPGPTGGRPR